MGSRPGGLVMALGSTEPRAAAFWLSVGCTQDRASEPKLLLSPPVPLYPMSSGPESGTVALAPIALDRKLVLAASAASQKPMPLSVQAAQVGSTQ